MFGSPAHFRRTAFGAWAENVCRVFQSAPPASGLGPTHPTPIRPLANCDGFRAVDPDLGWTTSRLHAGGVGSARQHNHVWMGGVANTGIDRELPLTPEGLPTSNLPHSTGCISK